MRVSIRFHIPNRMLFYSPTDAFPARSWSYDNLMTYPVMPPTMRKEKRIQRQVVDGVEKDVEVEVQVTQPFKQLFLFSGKEASV